MILVELNVARKNIFKDSYFDFNSRNADELKGKLKVTFKGEEG